MSGWWWFVIGLAVGIPLGEALDNLDYGGKWRKPVADVWFNWRNRPTPPVKDGET